MNYEILGLRLDSSVTIKYALFSDLFGIPEERADVLDRKVNMAKQILSIEKDLPRALAYFLDECKHPNESHYCMLKLGQKCDCSINGMVKVLTGSIEVDGRKKPGGIIEAILKNIMGNEGPKRRRPEDPEA